MKFTKLHIMLIAMLLLSIAAGIVFKILSDHYLKSPFSISSVNEAVQREINYAEGKLLQFAEFDSPESLKSIQQKLAQSNGHAVYVFKNSELIYWNNNQYSTNFSEIVNDSCWHLMKLNNASVLYKWVDGKNQYGFLYLIPIKNDYRYSNKYLRNSFNPAFDLPDQIEVRESDTESAFRIKDEAGNALFSLFPSQISNSENPFRIWGFVSFALAFAFFILLYLYLNRAFTKERMNSGQFLIISGIFLLVIFLTSYFEFPEIFYINQLFPAYQYAVNGIIRSFTHLTVYSIFLLACIHVYHQKVDRAEKRFIIYEKTVFYLFLILFFELIKSLIFHSGIQFHIFWFNDLNFINIWAHIIVFVFVLGFWFLMQLVFQDDSKKNTKKQLIIDIILLVIILVYEIISDPEHLPAYMLFITVLMTTAFLLRRILKSAPDFRIFTIYLIISSFLIFAITMMFSQEKKQIRYKVLSENILINGNAESDPIAELLLEELDKQLTSDPQISLLADSGNVLQKYIYQKYLRGFWNKYQIQIDVINRNSEDYSRMYNFMEYSGKKLGDTGFYSLPGSLYDMSYVGLIATAQNNKTENGIRVLIFQFQPKRNFKSYSFPDLLVNSEAELQSKPEISIARYTEASLIYSDSRFNWPEAEAKFNNSETGFSSSEINGRTYYLQAGNETTIVITELKQPNFKSYIIYLTFIILVYLLFARVLFILFREKSANSKITPKLTTRFQLVFIFLLLISFLGIFLFSVAYIRSKYQTEQIEQAEQKKKYIQKSMQDLYFWTDNLTNIDVDRLNNELEELAYIYQTDINIYNNSGLLIGSSQNLIFSRDLTSRLMSPKVFFSRSETGNTYENIGNLEYLAAYTEFINGDFLRLGYISIPQYFSQTEINAEIESYMTAIIQLYFLIIALSIILILIAGKQLSEPLRQLESKLRSMYFGGKNEKIEYRWNDEIGQLVEQYNRTVDELEKSTRLLLQSERETAWRTMARQVAHEINNPLTPMKLTIQQLQRTRKAGDEQFEAYFDKATKTLIEQIDNLSRIAGTFSQFARLPESTYTRVDVAAKLYSVSELFRNNFENISISYQGNESDIYIRGDSDQMTQVFNNIFKNACQAIGNQADGVISVIITTNNSKVFIAISDNGCGIAEEVKPDIFKPSFTTKSTGMGLGLSISKNIIELMGGTISFESDTESGTTFRIELEQI